jgi:hypothetical protein
LQGQTVSRKAREGKKTSSLLARMKKKKRVMTWTCGGVNSERSSYLAVVVGVGGGPSDVHPVAPGVVELRQPHEAEHLRESREHVSVAVAVTFTPPSSRRVPKEKEKRGEKRTGPGPELPPRQVEEELLAGSPGSRASYRWAVAAGFY